MGGFQGSSDPLVSGLQLEHRYCCVNIEKEGVGGSIQSKISCMLPIQVATGSASCWKCSFMP